MTQNGYAPAPPAPAPTPGRLGQGTAIEQARVWAEVAASVELARIAPRTTHRALTLMRESCAHPRLAEKAFYRYPRGGETVSGSTVQLARELARCFGHIHYGAVEMRRDDEYRQSELMAWAWDVEQGVRASTIFIVPHRRDTKRGSVDLVDLRDIYENNANLGARRLREMIKDVLPPWYVAEAEELCLKTLENGGGKPLAARRADAVALFGNQFGVTADQIVQKFNGRKVDDWTPFDLAQLTTIYQSLRMGTVTVEQEFPAERVTFEEIVGNGAQQAPHPPTPPPAPEDPPITDARRGQLHAAFREHGVDRDERLVFVSRLLRRQVPKFSDLRQSEAETINWTFEHMAERKMTFTEYAAYTMGLDEGGA